MCVSSTIESHKFMLWLKEPGIDDKLTQSLVQSPRIYVDAFILGCYLSLDVRDGPKCCPSTHDVSETTRQNKLHINQGLHYVSDYIDLIFPSDYSLLCTA